MERMKIVDAVQVARVNYEIALDKARLCVDRTQVRKTLDDLNAARQILDASEEALLAHDYPRKSAEDEQAADADRAYDEWRDGL